MPQMPDKKQLREEAKRIRMGASEMYGSKAAERAAEHGLKLFKTFNPGITIGAYWPMENEIDPRFLMHALTRAGFNLALPVTKKGEPLTFRRWGMGDPLVPGPMGTREPERDAPEVVPSALIIPLLAYDRDCYRLGWGGGFYDRTLAAHSEIKAFGFAYAAQYVEHIPREAHDWPLQGVITEEGVILPRKR